MNSNIENRSKRRKKLETRIISSKGRSLLDYELLELILYSTYREIKSRAVAERLIGLFGNIGKVISSDFYELKDVKEINNSAIASIFCIKETPERTLKNKLENQGL